MEFKKKFDVQKKMLWSNSLMKHSGKWSKNPEFNVKKMLLGTQILNDIASVK